MRVLAIDPGGTTGVAGMYATGAFWQEEVPDGFVGMKAWWEQTHPADAFPATLYPDVVVIESFTINAATHRKTPQPDALWIIGAIKWVSPVPVILQSPGEAKGFASDDKLRKLGWYHPTKGGHQNDAARHLLTYLAKQQDPILERLV